MSKHQRTLLLRPRNPITRSPLLRKGGPHLRSPKRARQQGRTEIARQLRNH